MKKTKLSIVSPCYNGEAFLEKYFTDLLVQTFKEYELIIVNDGSLDNSDKIIKRYMPIFKKNGIDFKYIPKKNNEGQIKAIEDGLAYVEGEYLMWPDIDDHLHSNHFETHVKFLDENKDFSVCIGRTAVYDINDLQKPLYYAWSKIPNNKDDLIKEFVLADSTNIGFMSGTFIIRTDLLWQIYPKRHIFSETYGGAAIQLVFPCMYFGKTGHLQECTFDYYIHGRNQHLLNELRDATNYEKTYENVISQLDIKKEDADRIIKFARKVTGRVQLSYALKHANKKMGINAYKKLSSDGNLDLKIHIKYLILYITPLRKLYSFIK